jgi:protein SCO1
VKGMTIKMYRTVAFFVAFFALMTGIWFAAYDHRHFDPESMHGTWLNTPRVLKPFQMQFTDGSAFTNDSLKGHWSMIYLGFTHCPQVCPITMTELAKTVRLLKRQGVSELPQVVMITVDPARDDVATMKEYVKGFHPDFGGAVPSEDVLKQVAHELGTAYEKQAGKSEDIEHTGAVMMFNPQGQLAGFFSYPHKAADLAQDFTAVVG